MYEGLSEAVNLGGERGSENLQISVTSLMDDPLPSSHFYHSQKLHLNRPPYLGDTVKQRNLKNEYLLENMIGWIRICVKPSGIN